MKEKKEKVEGGRRHGVGTVRAMRAGQLEEKWPKWNMTSYL